MGEGDAKPSLPKVGSPARAVASNLNSHFLFYFEILSGILGMLRRASCTALSTELVAGWRQESANGNKSLVRTSLQAQRVWDGPAGQRDGWMQAMERKKL